jgi:hypothetical protein
MLDLWDRAAGERSWRRALVLAGAERLDEAASWPLGERDRRLLELRRRLFGASLPLRQQCPECSTDLESVVDLNALPARPAESPSPFSHDGYTIRFRLPDSTSLAAVEHASSAEEARWALIEHCLEAAEYHGTPVAARELPASVIEALGKAVDTADPLANLELSFQCAHCGATFQVLFDAAACVWTEFDVWARRRLEEVHILASAYGWTEREVLSLSPRRRQAYIELATQ